MKENSWTQTHPRALHVRWSDNDNQRLVGTYYPEFACMYSRLKLIVQKTDVARLMYLHAFGGIYADEDYEAKENIFRVLGENKYSPKNVWIVRSPVLLNEVLQNSLMYARQSGNVFFRECLNAIQEIVNFMHDGCSFSPSCSLLYFVHHPVTSHMLNVLLTQYMTGPAVLDKTLVLHPKTAQNVGILEPELFFHGSLAKHHHQNSWVTLGSATFPISMFLIFFAVACSFFCVALLRVMERR